MTKTAHRKARIRMQFEKVQLEALRRLSAETGRPLVDLVHEGMELYLNSRKCTTREELIQRARLAAGKFSSGKKDISVAHDRHLAEIFRN